MENCLHKAACVERDYILYRVINGEQVDPCNLLQPPACTLADASLRNACQEQICSIAELIRNKHLRFPGDSGYKDGVKNELMMGEKSAGLECCQPTQCALDDCNPRG